MSRNKKQQNKKNKISKFRYWNNVFLNTPRKGIMDYVFYNYMMYNEVNMRCFCLKKEYYLDVFARLHKIKKVFEENPSYDIRYKAMKVICGGMTDNFLKLLLKEIEEKKFSKEDEMNTLKFFLDEFKNKESYDLFLKFTTTPVQNAEKIFRIIHPDY